MHLEWAEDLSRAEGIVLILEKLMQRDLDCSWLPGPIASRDLAVGLKVPAEQQLCSGHLEQCLDMRKEPEIMQSDHV